MKKFFTLLCMALVSAAGFAQDEYNPADHTAFVSGTENLCTGSWASADAMTYDSADGLWKITLPAKDTNLAMFKVVYDGGWYGTSEGGNVEVQVSEPSDVLITFDPSTFVVGFSGEKVIDVVKKIDFIVATGSDGLFGVSWDVSGEYNKMEKLDDTGDGYYQIALKEIAAGTYDFKFCANGTWNSGIEWGGLSDPTVINNGETLPATGNGGKNFRLTLDKGALYNVTLTLDLMAETPFVSAEWTATGDAPIEEDVYSLAGTFNDWDKDDTGAELTKVSEGVYSFTRPVKAGYYEFKVVQNHDWSVAYPADNYQLTLDQDADVTITLDITGEPTVIVTTAVCSVYFVSVTVKTTKEKLNVYACYSESWNKLTGEWPGEGMKAVEGGFATEEDLLLPKGEKLWLIFNDGDGGKTANIEVNGIASNANLEYTLNDDWTYENASHIQALTADKQNGAIYTLSGQRVEKAVRGLYIQKGHKFVVK